MSSSRSNKSPLRNRSPRSEASVSSVLPMKRKNPYIPWYIVRGKQIRSPSERYGPENDTYFTLQVSHGGTLVDRPGQTYRRSIVTYFEAVNVKRLDLDELHLISRHLGYRTVGKWYCMNEDPHASLELLPLQTEVHISCFLDRVKKNKCLNVEQVFVEHGDPSEFMYLPKDVMESGKKRIEKVVYLLVLSNPMATVDDGIERVRWMMGLPVSRAKMERALNQARKKLGMWLYSRGDT